MGPRIGVSDSMNRRTNQSVRRIQEGPRAKHFLCLGRHEESDRLMEVA
jgi:hypothetical protein